MSNGRVDPDMVAHLEEVSVTYGATRAVDRVSLALPSGCIHALLGENGAGKSTLLKVLAGRVRPAHGRVSLAAGCRVEYVPQETELPLALHVHEWLFLGRERQRFPGWVDARFELRQAAEWLERFSLPVRPDTPLASLSAPLLQWVRLLRAFMGAPQLLLLDEPTAVFDRDHSERLFAHLQALRTAGCTIVLVTHRLDEVAQIADQVTVLRDGQAVATGPQSHFSPTVLLALMAGDASPAQARLPVPGEEVLRVHALRAGSVRRVSLSLRAGEIAAVVGLAGSGRSTVLEVLAGLRPFAADELRRTLPVVLVPEDRFRKGLCSALSVRENVFLPASRWFLRPRQETALLRKWGAKVQLRAPDVEAPVTTLSGGNQQKVLLLRALRQRPRVLLLDEPTAGVDVATKAELHQLFRELAAHGSGILWAASDVHEVLANCHRVLCFRQGELVASVPARHTSERAVVAWITGARPPQPAGERCDA